MSEEFSMNVTFEMDSAEQMEALETLLEHLDLYETDEARELLNQHHLAKAQQCIEALTSSYSNYGNQNDLVNMYIDTFDDSVGDIEKSLDNSSLTGKLFIEGHDHDADDFCAAQVLLLIAIGATNINASGGSPHWFAKWESDKNNTVHLEFSEEE